MNAPATAKIDEITGHVLVVDDERPNRELLRDLLELQGHRISEAEDGNQALECVAEELPDLILLDVMMPGLGGFEVCRRLKADPRTAHIPVLLVTALVEREDRLQGMGVGASDFLHKPIDAQDVMFRVRNAIFSKRLYDRVQEQYVQLKELEGLRDNMIHMIVHDLRSPLTGIRGFLDLLRMTAKDRLDEEERDYLQQALALTGTLGDMVTSVLDVNRLESGKMPLEITACDMREAVRKGIEPLGHLSREGRLSVNLPSAPLPVYCDQELISRVVANMVNNAAKFSPRKEPVQVEVIEHDAWVRVQVRDRGPGIPAEFHQRIFEKFGLAEARQKNQKHSTGLGLAFCKLAVEVHGGCIGLESAPGEGSTFWFELPARVPTGRRKMDELVNA